MTQETEQLANEIRSMRAAQSKPRDSRLNPNGYGIALTILTDLLGCIFVGFAIGTFLQWSLNTTSALTAGLTLLGGIAGLWTTVRYALRLDKINGRKRR